MPHPRRQSDGLRPLGKDRWQVRVSAGRREDADGRITYPEVSKVVIGTRADAATARLMLLADTGHQVRGMAEQITVGQLVRRWLDGRDDIEDRTRYDYEGYLRRHIDPALGHRPIGAVTPMELEAVYKRWRDDGASPRYIRLIQTPLRAAMGAAADRWGMIPRNPVTAAKIPSGSARRAKFIMPTAEQIAALVQAAWDVNPVMQVLTVVAVGSGMRRGELCGLQWGDIDPDRQELTVRRAIAEVGDRMIEKDPKTHAERTVHVPAQVVDVLAEWRDYQAGTAAGVGGAPGPWVASTSGDTPVWPGTVTKWWRQTCEAAGVTGVRLHDLRHAYATWALSQGTKPVDVASQLGHQSPMMTLTVYGHSLTEGQRKVADVIAGRLPVMVPRTGGQLDKGVGGGADLAD